MQNRNHSRQRLRLGDIDSFDLRMRMRAAQRPCEGHAVLAHVFGVVTEVGDDTESVEARNSLPDDIKSLGLWRSLCGRTRCRSLRSSLWPRRGLPELGSVASEDRRRHLAEFAD